MATTPNEALLAKMSKFKDFERGQYARAAGAAIGGAGPALIDPRLGWQYADRMFAREDGAIDPVKAAQIRRDAIGDIQGIANDARARDFAAAKAGASLSDRRDALVKVFLEDRTKRGQINTGAVNDFNVQNQKIMSDAVKASLDSLGDPRAKEAGEKVSSFYLQNRIGFTAEGTIETLTPNFWSDLHATISDGSAEDINKVVEAALQFPGGMAEFRAHAAAMKDLRGEDARYAQNILETLDAAMTNTDVKDMIDARAKVIDEYKVKAQDEMLRGGISGLTDPKVKAEWEVFKSMADADGKLFGSSTTGGKDGDPTTDDPGKTASAKAIDELDKLLADLDQPNLPTHLAEARRQVIESDDFKRWMAENSLSDPDTAFRELRRRTTEKKFANQQADRQQLRKDALARGTGQSPSSPSASAAGGTVGLGSASSSPAVPAIGAIAEKLKIGMSDEDKAAAMVAEAAPTGGAAPVPAPQKPKTIPTGDLQPLRDEKLYTATPGQIGASFLRAVGDPTWAADQGVKRLREITKAGKNFALGQGVNALNGIVNPDEPTDVPPDEDPDALTAAISGIPGRRRRPYLVPPPVRP